MSQEVFTLEDLLHSRLRTVVVGINPSPVSVAVGHYYQGKLGQRFYKRLDRAGVIDLSAAGFQDDAAFTAGIGFTDVVKRPTARAHDLRPGELEHGRELLEAKLARLRIPKVMFTFKAGAEALLGPLKGPGLQDGQTLASTEIFVMPGPVARTDLIEETLCALRAWWKS
jgi:TDG/mug DNA glycosylase family protein